MSYKSNWHTWYYNIYLKSLHWQEHRESEYRRACYRCEMCGKSNTKLSCHHESYNRLWKELGGIDTVVLCEECHQFKHSKFKTFEEQKEWCKKFKPRS